jgi:hypothetical protein
LLLRPRSEKYYNKKPPLRRRLSLLALIIITILGSGIYWVNAADNVLATGTLIKHGPIHEDNGFPVWYKDAQGTRMQLCLDAADPMCAFAPEDIPDPTKPISFKDNNFPTEAFYQLASAEMETGGGGRARATFALEAAWENEIVREGDQIVFGRVRFRIDGLIPNSKINYKVTHPYGVDEFKAEVDDDEGEIRFVEDIGIADGFTGPFKSRIGPFLKWDTEKPEGYLGDPLIDHTITGSVINDSEGNPQNYFRIEGEGSNIGLGSPDVCKDTKGKENPDCIETKLFSLMGKEATTMGVDIQKATYTRDSATGGTIDVYAASEDSDEPLEVVGVPSATGGTIERTLMLGGKGQYYARVTFAGDPTKVKVTNLRDKPVSSKEIMPVDQIIGTAVYDTENRTLRVSAESSDKVKPPTLTVEDHNKELVNGSVIIDKVSYTSPYITVTSSHGGTAILPVKVQGGSFTSIPLVAHAGGNQQVVAGTEVILDGSNSTGPIASYSWEQLSGTDVDLVLVDGKPESVKFNAPDINEKLVFQLTIKGPDGRTHTDTVDIAIGNVPVSTDPPNAHAGVDQKVNLGEEVTLNGEESESGQKLTYSWKQLTGLPVVLQNPDTATPTFTAPDSNSLLIFELTVTDEQGRTDHDFVNVEVGEIDPDWREINAVAAVEQPSVNAGEPVTLEGSGSTGPITSYSWKQTKGPEVEISGKSGKRATFIAPNVTDTLEFELTITSSYGETKTSIVSVEVVYSPNPTVANAGTDQLRVKQNSTVKLNGLGSTGVKSYSWRQISGPEVLLVNANTAEPSFTVPKKYPATMEFELTVTGDGVGPKVDSVIVTTAPDNLTITAAEYRSAKSEWRLDGTTDVAGPGVTITIKVVVGGTEIVVAEVLPDATGAWRYRGTGPNPGNARMVTVVSSSGGVVEESALRVK